MDSRALDVFTKMLLETDEIALRLETFGIDEDTWNGSRAMRDLILMPLIQIGELMTHLKGDEHLALFPQVPWREIKGFRNIIVHGYGHIDPGMAWDAVTMGIPELRTALLSNDEVFCRYEEEVSWESSRDNGQGNDLFESIAALPPLK